MNFIFDPCTQHIAATHVEGIIHLLNFVCTVIETKNLITVWSYVEIEWYIYLSIQPWVYSSVRPSTRLCFRPSRHTYLICWHKYLPSFMHWCRDNLTFFPLQYILKLTRKVNLLQKTDSINLLYEYLYAVVYTVWQQATFNIHHSDTNDVRWDWILRTYLTKAWGISMFTIRKFVLLGLLYEREADSKQ